MILNTELVLSNKSDHLTVVVSRSIEIGVLF